MPITQITNYVQDGLSKLMEQYKQSPRMIAIITAFLEQVQEAEDGIYPIYLGRMLAFAFGAQLDGIGEIVGLQRNGLDDDTYRVFLIGTISKNFSDTTVTTIQTMLDLLLDAAIVRIYEMFPAEIDVQFAGSSRDESLIPLIAMLVQEALGAGINLGSITKFDPVNAFTFEGADGGGFGDANDASVGGEFAGVVYINGQNV